MREVLCLGGGDVGCGELVDLPAYRSEVEAAGGRVERASDASANTPAQTRSQGWLILPRASAMQHRASAQGQIINGRNLSGAAPVRSACLSSAGYNCCDISIDESPTHSATPLVYTRAGHRRRCYNAIS